MVRKLKYGSPSKYGKLIGAASRLAQKYVTPKNVLRVTKAVYDKVRKTPSKPKSNFRVFKKQDRSTQTHNRKTGRQFGGHSVGAYQGKFKNTRSIPKTIEQRCLSMGAHRTLEQFGTFSDPDCVYIQHSTSNFEEISKVMNACLLRKVLNKSGFKITNAYNELAVTNPVAGVGAIEDSSGLKFILTMRNSITGDHVNFTYDTLNNQTFKDITIAWTALQFRIIDYMRGDTKDELYKLAIYRKDEYSFGTQWRMGAEIFLEDISINLYFASALVLQNRTKAANVTTDDGNLIERVDSQPLKGIIYDFKHADPRVRHSGGFDNPFGDTTNIIFNRTTEGGLDIIRGAEYQGATEPFDPKYFANTSKSVNIKLQPGEMKKTSFTYEFSGKLINVLKKLRVARRDGAYISGQVGKCQMVALEELLRTPSANLITIAYERELKTGCIVKENKRQAQLETFTNSAEVNNNP